LPPLRSEVPVHRFTAARSGAPDETVACNNQELGLRVGS
jgi:hypothetical protein